MALQVKQGSFSLNNATGNQVVSWSTGGNWPSSATPKLVLFLATGQTADGTAQHGIGMLGAAASSTQRWVLSQASDDAAAAVNSGQSARTTACIVLLSNGTPTVQAVADFVSFGAEQFTINVTTAPGVTGIQIGYIAFGGADLTDVAVGSSTIPTVTGNQAITPTGFTGKTPDAILTAVPYQPASPTESVHSHFGLGWATGQPSTAQGVASMMEVDASTAIDTQRIFLTNMCVAGAETAITGHVRGSLGSWDADGFTVNWADAAAVASRIWLYVAVKGGNWQCGVETEAATNTGKATTPSGFSGQTPRGLLLVGSNGTADTANTDTANGDCLVALGASDGATEFAVANIQVNGSASTSNSLAKRRLAATKAISLVKTPTTTSPWATVCGEADATFSAGQFSLAWASTDGTARRFLWLAIGDNRPAPPAGTFVSDSFSGIAGQAWSAHVGEVGATWTRHPSYASTGGQISNANRLRANVANATVLYYASGTPAGADYDVTAMVYCASVAGDGEVGCAARVDTAATTFYVARYEATSGQWMLDKVVAGVGTNLGVFAQTLTAGQTYTLALGLRGTGLTLAVDGTTRISATDGDITAAGRVAGYLAPAATTPTDTVGLHLDSLSAVDVAGGGTVFTISPSGALTGGGALALLGKKPLAATLTDSGLLARRANKPLAGTLTLAGAPRERAQKPLAGALTSTGALTNSKLASVALAGVLTAAGALANRANKALSGALTAGGALARQANKALAGALTPSGGLTKRANKPLAGTLTDGGALTNVKVAVLALAGTLPTAGALARRANKALTGGLTGAGALAKQAAKPLVGGLATAGALARRANRALAGALAPGGALANVYQAGAAAVALGRVFALGARQLTMRAAGRLTTLAAEGRDLSHALRGRVLTLAAKARQLTYRLRGR